MIRAQVSNFTNVFLLRSRFDCHRKIFLRSCRQVSFVTGSDLLPDKEKIFLSAVLRLSRLYRQDNFLQLQNNLFYLWRCLVGRSKLTVPQIKDFQSCFPGSVPFQLLPCRPPPILFFISVAFSVASALAVGSLSTHSAKYAVSSFVHPSFHHLPAAFSFPGHCCPICCCCLSETVPRFSVSVQKLYEIRGRTKFTCSFSDFLAG